MQAVRVRLAAAANAAFVPDAARAAIGAAVDDALAWFASAAGGGAAASAEAFELKQHEVEALIRAQVASLKMAGGQSFGDEVAAAVASGVGAEDTPLQMLGAVDLD